MYIPLIPLSIHLKPGPCITLVRPGHWGLLIGITPTLQEDALWIGLSPVTRWLDKHNIHQALRTLWIGKRFCVTVTASSGQKATIDQVSRWKRMAKFGLPWTKWGKSSPPSS